MNNTQKSTPISKEEIPTLLNKAGQFYNARNLPEAEKIYRRILDTDPQNPYGLNMLGMIALDVGRLVDAEALVRKAIAGRNDLALFHDTLGTILMRQGKADEAISSFEKSLALKPDYVDSLNGLAGIFIFLERKDEALELFKRALAANPGHFNTLSNTGAALQHIGRHREAIEYYKKALDVNPHAADVYYNIGQAYRAINKLKEAKTYYYKAIECKPDYANAFLNLGYTYGEENNRDEALKYFYHTIQIEPNVNAYANIAHLLTKKGMLMGALEHYKLAHNISPSSPEILNNMGTIYNLLTRYEEAMDCYDKALAFDPNSANTFNNIGTTLKNLGRLDEAIETYKKAIELDPGRAEIHSNLLLVMNYSASVKPEELTAEAQKFDIIAKPFLRTRKMVRNFDPDRKLKIGYVSADFRSHAVHYFFEPLLNLRDSKQFEIYIYSNTEMEDEVTARLKKKCDHWHDIQTMSDEAVAILIESNKIDILMDISGHTGGNRLMAFARKPAPIQITWLAYPATTGLTAMDYRITDSYAEPPGMTEHLNTETLWRLPEIFCCYQADKNSPPVIDHPPFEDNGFITFGCFNNFSKVTDPVLSIWGKIMAQVPDSRLLLEIS
ncbi:MAG: tetratricopeptide repeat protein, partial [Alphaproteobacteria bacterium]